MVVCCEMMVFMVSGMKHNFKNIIFSFYRNPDLDYQIYYYLLTSMAIVQAEEVHASFLFVGDLKGNHKEWLGYTTTNRSIFPYCFIRTSVY